MRTFCFECANLIILEPVDSTVDRQERLNGKIDCPYKTGPPFDIWAPVPVPFGINDGECPKYEPGTPTDVDGNIPLAFQKNALVPPQNLNSVLEQLDEDGNLLANTELIPVTPEEFFSQFPPHVMQALMQPPPGLYTPPSFHNDAQDDQVIETNQIDMLQKYEGVFEMALQFEQAYPERDVRLNKAANLLLEIANAIELGIADISQVPEGLRMIVLVLEGIRRKHYMGMPQEEVQ